MSSLLPEIPEADDTPLVRQLVEIIRDQQERHPSNSKTRSPASRGSRPGP